MAARKKGKRIKWQPLPLESLLPETPGGVPATNMNVLDWASDIDIDHDYHTSKKSQEPVVLPTAPRAARGPGVDEENIPMNPPFVAYISNLSYDVEEADLAEFFEDLQVTGLRLPKDAVKSKGNAYVDFEDRQSLIDALAKSNMPIKGRRVRIDVSHSNSDDRRGRMGRDYGRRDNYDDADRGSTNWRGGPRDEPPPGDGDRFRSRGGGFDRDRGERREERDTSPSANKPGAWREGRAALPDLPERGGFSFGDRRGFRSDDKDREYSRFGDRGSRDQEGSDRGGGSSFGPRRNYGDRDRNYGDRERGSERERGGDRESDWGNRLSSRPSASDPPASGEPRTRVKLNLAPRTKPVPVAAAKDETSEEKDESEGDAPESAAAPASASSASAPTPAPAGNIFGAAKPVDTTAREREIEERLARTYADAKSREEGDRKGPSKEGTWGRRNGEGRSDNEKEKPRSTWRSEDDRGRQVERPTNRNTGSGRSDAGDSRGPPPSRTGVSGSRGGQKPSESRGAPERERKDRDREDSIPPMPKATDEQAPNFVASNKYSMLHEDADSDTSYN